MPWWRTSAVWLCGWLAVALLLRLGAALVVDDIVSQTPGRLCLIEGDADGYWQLARKLAQGEDYSLYDPPRRILRMPGFPVLLAGCQLVFGDQLFPVRCVLAVIGTLGCAGVYVLGRQLVDSTVGLWACAAVSLSPPLVAFTPLLLTETAFATTLVFSLIPLVALLKPAAGLAPAGWPGLDRREDPVGETGVSRVRSNSGHPTQTPPVENSDRPASTVPFVCWSRLGYALATGFAIAVATYIRPTWLPMAGVAALSIVAAGGFRPGRCLEAAVVLLSCSLLLAPWTYRNYVVSGHAIPTTLWVGPSLYDGLNPEATGDSNMTFFDRDNLLATMSEYDMDREYRQRAWQYAADHPQRAVELALIKAARYWSPWPNAPQFQRPLIRLGMIAATLPLYLLALYGLWRQRDWRFWLCTLGPALFFSAVHMLFVGSIRYRLPADYVLWIAAATGLVSLAASFRPPRDQGALRWGD